jgi:hypothetical protein
MMADGLLGKCKECARSDVRANRKARLAYYTEYDRVRNATQDRHLQKSYAPRNRKSEGEAEKKKARTILSNAIRDRKISRPTECQVCGHSEKLHGHHDDYSKPLDVIWCCRPCHTFIHAYWRAQDRR